MVPIMVVGVGILEKAAGNTCKVVVDSRASSSEHRRKEFERMVSDTMPNSTLSLMARKEHVRAVREAQALTRFEA